MSLQYLSCDTVLRIYYKNDYKLHSQCVMRKNGIFILLDIGNGIYLQCV